MLLKQSVFMLCILLISVLSITACTPASESAATDGASNSAENNAGAGAAESASTPATPQVQSNNPVTVATTPISTTAVALQTPGQSAPGAGAETVADPAEPAEPQEQLSAGALLTYSDSTYQFSVNYLSDFVLQTPAADQLAQFDPTPVASFRFMNPVTAASDLGELEPADLEILVFDKAQATTLDSWLAANGLVAADGGVPPQSFQTAHVSGVEICPTMLITPGCFYFVMGNQWVYRLMAATIEGESMIETFQLNQ